VAGDPYELRIVWPAESTGNVQQATLGGQALETIEANGQGLRLKCTPTMTGAVDWQIKFVADRP